ncbi:MAG: response regulator [Fibrobacterota bacterium]|nr:response regulator [Chitinispirillaceae bacterium]
MNKIKVLVIDDEKLLLKSTCLALQQYGFDAKGALDGIEGIEAAITFQPDVILLDIMMPGMDGWQVLSILKKHENCSSIPVIVFSAKEYFNGLELALEHGANDFISKPFTIQALIRVLRNHAGNGDERRTDV